MLASAIILFRETLEAALIISIVLSATRGLRHRGIWVSLGGAGGAVGAILVALFAKEISALAEGTGQELFNAGVLLTACAMLGWHNVWMASHGRAISARTTETCASVNQGKSHLSALAVVVGLAVLREGAEVVLFITGILAAGTTAPSMLGGAALGLMLGVVLGIILYQGLLRIPLRHFFNVTNWLVLLLASSLALQAAGFLAQAGSLTLLQQPVWDTSRILTENSIVGRLLHSLIGYTARPSGMQLIFWVCAFAMIRGLSSLIGRKYTDRRTLAQTVH